MSPQKLDYTSSSSSSS